MSHSTRTSGGTLLVAGEGKIAIADSITTCAHDRGTMAGSGATAACDAPTNIALGAAGDGATMWILLIAYLQAVRQNALVAAWQRLKLRKAGGVRPWWCKFIAEQRPKVVGGMLTGTAKVAQVHSIGALQRATATGLAV
ncbi:hypothetical protein C2845_PM01G43350 [Panicum miliaceum]|uniref:Uncharacterized protein n=1 Tax=Panicum miliaceum TaxID=4540 RepID=A0A3L6TK83_PANMI|nr:hypothetical protein C2845_PM01G43350 [Panicum miliaceum]